MSHDFESIAKHFHIEGLFRQAEPFGSGHIHDTFIIVCQNDTRTFRYVLQRINHEVFKDPPAMMENIIRVTDHIREKLQPLDPVLAARQLRVIDTSDNTGCYKDENANYWRIYNLIENAFTSDVMDNQAQTYEAARMFGWFQKILIDLPGPILHETIPDFHNTPKRLRDFDQILNADPCNRAANVKDEIEFARDHQWMCPVLLDLAEKGQIPTRIVHNDTKINNVMLDTDTGKGICVIDLDTVMPGLSLYDFGDMIRTATTGADEDETDLSKVNLKMPLFEALLSGFCKETFDFLTPAEKSHLVFAGKIITFEQFLRFLADHIAGDIYYKIHRPDHNLDRCRTQLKLIQSITASEDRMNALVEKL